MYFPYTDSPTINIPHKDGTCVIFSKTTVYRIITQSPFLGLDFTFGFVHSMGCICDMYPTLEYHTELFHCHKIPLFFLSVHPLPDLWQPPIHHSLP